MMQSERIKKITSTLVGVILIAVVWSIAAHRINEIIVLPTINQTFKAVEEIFNDSFARTAIFWSAIRLVTSIIIAVVIGYVAAVVASFNKTFERVIAPSVSVLRTIPVVATIIVLILIFGWNKAPYILVASVVVPLVYQNMLVAYQDIPRDYKDVASIYTDSKIKYVLKVGMPTTLTTFAGTLIQSVGLGSKVLITGELIAQTPDSIGRQISNARFMLRTDIIFGWVLLIILFALLLEMFIRIYKSKKRP